MDDSLLDDLEAEENQLAALLAGLDAHQWDLPTPAAGWTVRDQVAHLAEGEELASLAATDPAAFSARLTDMLADLGSALTAMEERGRGESAADVFARWQRGRAATMEALRAYPDGQRIAWVSGPMSIRSFATARLMETFAHGHDVAEATGANLPPSPRLRHIAHLGAATRRFSFTNRGLTPPEADVRLELDLPDGSQWTSGPEGAAERITGPVDDFCLVVTQRRNVADTDLTVEGEGANRWMAIAQCFAGRPTDPPPAR